MTWKEGEDVTFENGLIEDFDNYEIDKHLYKEIPLPEHVSSREGQMMLTAIRKSDKIAIRQSARIAHSVQRFDKKSSKLSMWMIRIIFFQSIILIVQLIMLFGKR